MRWLITSGLANQSSPTLTTPKCINIKKLSSNYLFCIRMRTNPSISERTHSMPKLSKKAIFIKEYKAIVASRVSKAYIRFCLDDEDSFEDEIDECMLRELAVLKASRYIFRGSYRQWETTWERALWWQVSNRWWVFVSLSHGSVLCHAVKQSGGEWSRV